MKLELSQQTFEKKKKKKKRGKKKYNKKDFKNLCRTARNKQT
jgi:hypothetical protein